MTVTEPARAAMADREALDRTAAEAVRRPAPHRWLWYALGGGLPERHRGWVLHDTTARTWVLRHLARMFVQLALPIGLVLTLVPGEFWIRGMAALGGIFLAMFFSMAYMFETTENRIVRAGFPAGTATAHRERSALLRQQQERERKRAAAAKRAARYRRHSGR